MHGEAGAGVPITPGEGGALPSTPGWSVVPPSVEGVDGEGVPWMVCPTEAPPGPSGAAPVLPVIGPGVVVMTPLPGCCWTVPVPGVGEVTPTLGTAVPLELACP